MRKLNYKKLIIWGVSLIAILGVLISLIVFLVSNKDKTVETSANITQNNNENIVIPNVTKQNTTFKISETKKEIESVSISATNKLTEYNLYYYLKFDNSEIKDEDYLIFNDLLLILDENCTVCFKYELDGNFSNDAYEVKISNIKMPEVETEKATEEELKKEKVTKTEVKKSTLPYYIKVNYKANVVTIYKKDSDGNYTVPFKVMVCSCGTYTPTSGTYKTTNKYTWRPLINNVYGQYATRIVGSILFHSVPYTSNKKDTLEYWEYDKLGTTASAGCVRLTVRDAKWIYDNCPRGTMVEFYASSNPGPLGKPSAQKISSVTECRNWDPTDPASGNPWHTYKPEKEENTTNNTVTNSTTNTTNTITNTIAPGNTTNSVNSTNNTITNSINNNVTNTITSGNTITNSTANNSVTVPSNNTVNTNNTASNNSVNNNTSNNSATSNTNSTTSNNKSNTTVNTITTGKSNTTASTPTNNTSNNLVTTNTISNGI